MAWYYLPHIMEYILLSHAFDIPIYATHFLQLFVISHDIKHFYYG